MQLNDIYKNLSKTPSTQEYGDDGKPIVVESDTTEWNIPVITEKQIDELILNDDFIIDMGNLNAISETVDDVIEDLIQVTEDQPWWGDKEFLTSYMNVYNLYTDDKGNITDDAGLSAALRADADIGTALIPFGGRAVFNRQQDAKRTPTLFEQSGANYYETLKDFITTKTNKETAAALDSTIRLIADNWNKGVYGDTSTSEGSSLAQAKATRNITALIDPYVNYTADDDIIASVQGKTFDTMRTKEDEVQDLLDKGLPKWLHSNFTVSEEAGKWRNNEMWGVDLKERIKDSFHANYSMYDREVSWSDVLSNKLTTMKQILGVDVSQTLPDGSVNPLLDRVIRINDSAEESEFLRGKGLELGYTKVMDDVAYAGMQAYGDDVVTSQAFLEQ